MAGLIKTQAGSLVAALALCALPGRGRQTVLGAVLTADSGGLSLTTTDYAATSSIRFAGEGEGALALPAEPLAALAAHFPGDNVLTIAADDGAATITRGGSRFKLPVISITDLPERHILGEETGRVEFDSKTACDLFLRPLFAVSDGKDRPYLAGVFLHNAGDKVVAVATDAYRLCRVTAPATAALSLDRKLIVPREMAKIIARLLGAAPGNVTLRRSERLFSVEGAGFTLVSTRVDSTYPNYERWIPSEGPNVVTTNRVRLGEALARFAAVADPQTGTHVVSLRWDAGGLRLRADGSEDCLAAGVEGEGETAVQIRYLAELIGALRGDSVRISVAEPGSMILVTDPEDETFFAGQMPIRPRSS
jgi:DNA polymerase-3 subunit beta